MAIEVQCASCGEEENLTGQPAGDSIAITCGSCGITWERSTSPRCPRCDGEDMQPVPLAIVEKSRGTQLSIVGIRTLHLCPACDIETIDRWHRGRPRPLFPDELPTDIQ
jgi:predicted RNA-binding Zn-ribbon protein involved in translation (DUF1610 family)